MKWREKISFRQFLKELLDDEEPRWVWHICFYVLIILFAIN